MAESKDFYGEDLLKERLKKDWNQFFKKEIHVFKNKRNFEYKEHIGVYDKIDKLKEKIRIVLFEKIQKPDFNYPFVFNTYDPNDFTPTPHYPPLKSNCNKELIGRELIKFLKSFSKERKREKEIKTKNELTPAETLYVYKKLGIIKDEDEENIFDFMAFFGISPDELKD